MRKIILSGITAITLTSSLGAKEFTLYEDEKGQVFTSSGVGRTELVLDTKMFTKNTSKSTPLFAKSDKIKFSALSYFGYNFAEYDTIESTSQFEIRRAYFQVKAYLLDDKKSYYRVTFDVHQDQKQNGDTTDGDNLLRVKYAYLYIDDILPATGIELGIAHRPWHDYEEHHSWYFRDISKVLVEQGNAANLSNSADFGINFKTKTKYFDSEIGLFNGEGYHDVQNARGMSLEWRTTAHLLGVSGKDKEKEKTYWDISSFGQYNMEHKAVNGAGIDDDKQIDEDLIFYGLHTVYNQPEFLLAGEYIYSVDTRDDDFEVSSGDNGVKLSDVSAQAGKGYSFNAEYRLGSKKQFRILGRYDSWTPKIGADIKASDLSKNYEQKTYIGGLAWDQNRNIQWVANIDITDNEDGSSREQSNGKAYKLTAQVKF
jgi:hypothetical protein